MGDWRATCWRHVTVVLACFLNPILELVAYSIKFWTVNTSRESKRFEYLLLEHR